MRRLQIAALVLALGIGASIGLAARAAPAMPDARDPVPLRGVPLRGETGLRLLVPNNPPIVLDVDSGSVSPTGVPAMARGALRISGIGGRAAVVVQHSHWQRKDIYAVRGRDAHVSKLGTGANVWPAADGRSGCRASSPDPAAPCAGWGWTGGNSVLPDRSRARRAAIRLLVRWDSSHGERGYSIRRPAALCSRRAGGFWRQPDPRWYSPGRRRS